MYILPQEIEVWYIIPAIRRELSKCLIKHHKVTYEKAGKILGISKAAISQYLSNKRASKIKLHPLAGEEVCLSCEKLSEGKGNVVKEMQRVLSFVRNNELHCEVCGKMVESAPHDCKQIITSFKDA